MTTPRPQYYECTICHHLHPIDWNGDCRDDANRFTWGELDNKHGLNEWDIAEMPD